MEYEKLIKSYGYTLHRVFNFDMYIFYVAGKDNGIFIHPKDNEITIYVDATGGGMKSVTYDFTIDNLEKVISDANKKSRLREISNIH